jgi:hypothetical protein
MAAEWKWTKQREEAARLLAEDRATNEAIASKLDIGLRTLLDWKTVPEFAARVKEHVEAYRDACMAEGIADKRNRVRRLSETHRGLLQVIAERADDPDMLEVSGGTTGLLVKTVRRSKGSNDVWFESAVIDKALLSELREIEQQAAKELGQWSEKVDLTFAPKVYTDAAMDDV